MFGVLQRKVSNEMQTQGVLSIFNLEGKVIYKCNTLELGWKDNQRNISCIPTGSYKVVKHSSPRYKECFWVKNVEGRSEILIHAGNFFSDTRGCILPGRSHTDLDYDGFEDVTASRATLKELLSILPNEWTLTIKNNEDISSSAFSSGLHNRPASDL